MSTAQARSKSLSQLGIPTAGSSEYEHLGIDMIPSGWFVASVGALFDFFRTAANSRADLGDTGNVAYVHYGDIHTRFHHFIDFSRDLLPSLSENKSVRASRLRDGDLIVADASEDEPGVGKSVEVCNLGEVAAVAGLHTLLLRSKDLRVIDGFRGYLLETMPAKQQLRQFATGLKVFGISKRSLRAVHVLLPPPTEQRAIAEALWDVDGLLGALEVLIAKKQAIKKAAQQQLLTGKTRLPGFSRVWRTIRLGDICTFLPTANNPRADLSEDGDVHYIHYGDVHAYTRPVMDCASSDLPRILRTRVGNAAELADGDLVMVDASEDLPGVGKSIEVQGVLGRAIVAGLHTILCRGTQDAWAMGFKAYLQYLPVFRSALVRVTSGTSVYAISKKQLADITLQLPALREQEAIVSVLSDIDSEIAALERRKKKTHAIKQAMMQELLTGSVRLVNPDVAAEASAC